MKTLQTVTRLIILAAIVAIPLYFLFAYGIPSDSIGHNF